MYNLLHNETTCSICGKECEIKALSIDNINPLLLDEIESTCSFECRILAIDKALTISELVGKL